MRDQTGAETSADLDFTVHPTGLVSLTPELLPDGLIGAPYNIPILPDGGTPPYQCTLVAGQLPPGLSLSGCATTISGVPRLPGVFGFAIRIRDSAKLPRTLVISRHVRVVEKPTGPDSP